MERSNLAGFPGHIHREYYGGVLMLLIGLGAAWMGFQYRMGDLRSMGPGFFPVSVGAILALLGMLIAMSAGARQQAEAEADDAPLRPEWRGWFCIMLSIAAFVVIGRFGGLLPATFAIVFIAALGDRQNTLRSAAILALAMCAICVVVFWWALKLQFPLFAWGA
ncbi:tripartite tricarboxylate transporter TctB family protein [Caballeronia sp. LjRoot31]|uniref:tripartite tricarboxylate transporter TctB family protein n=1 Tax=Caballeronia sp. LjRoot31 TaxID=3342324 RepID=UPI003ECDD1B5